MLSITEAFHPPKGLLDVPETVVRNHLLPHLDLPSILRLRHVHPITRQWVITCEKSQVLSAIWKRTPHEIEIDEIYKNLQHMFQMKAPNPINFCTNLYIKNHNNINLYFDPGFDKFKAIACGNIRKLHVQKSHLFVEPNEFEFFNSLVCLQTLHIDTLDTVRLTVRQFENPEDFIPAPLKNVKELSVGRIEYRGQASRYLEQRRYIRNVFFPAFKSLEHLKSPREPFIMSDVDHLRNNPEHFDVPFVNLFPFNRIAEGEEIKTTLKVIDLLSVKEPYLDMGDFLTLIFACIKNSVELRNVRSSFFLIPEPVLLRYVNRVWRLLPPEVENYNPRVAVTYPLHSMVNVTPCVFRIPCPNLKKIQITTCHWCATTLPRINEVGQTNPFHWPQLEELDLNITFKKLGAGFIDGDNIELLDDTEVFLQYLFGTLRGRPSLKFLKVNMMDYHGKRDPFKKLSTKIAASCPNLTKLELCGWKGGNHTFWPFWNWLPNLEEVCLTKCYNLGDSAFLGDNFEMYPSFLKLEKLRSLSLKGLNRMTNITDLTFYRVIRHLPLQTFQITSDAPIKNVTIQGIRHLLSGQFSETIELFPFYYWSLHGVSQNDFTKLSLNFRSTHLRILCDPKEHLLKSRKYADECLRCSLLSSIVDSKLHQEVPIKRRTIFQKIWRELSDVILAIKKRQWIAFGIVSFLFVYCLEDYDYE